MTNIMTRLCGTVMMSVRTRRSRLTFRWLTQGFMALAVLVPGCGSEDGPTIPPNEIPYVSMADWSPDGRAIAVAWGGSPTVRAGGLYLIDTADWSIAPLFAPDDEVVFCFSPSWSPDGEWLAFGCAGRIFKIKSDGDSLTQLTTFGEQFYCDWSPAGTLIVSVVALGPESGSWLYDTEGENRNHFAPSGSDPAFLGSDSILLVRNSLTNPADSAEIVAKSISGGGERIVLRWSKNGTYRDFDLPKYSVAKRRIACAVDGRIVTMSAEGNDMQFLTSRSGVYPYCQFPNWSPDGNKIVYNEYLGVGGGLWIMNSDGSDKQKVPGW